MRHLLLLLTLGSSAVFAAPGYYFCVAENLRGQKFSSAARYLDHAEKGATQACINSGSRRCTVKRCERHRGN